MHLFFKSIQKEQGTTLPVALMFMAILSLVGGTAMVLSNTDLKISTHYRSNAEAFYDAEAGVSYTIGRIESELKNDSEYDIETHNQTTPSGFNFQVSGISEVSSKVYGFNSTGYGPNNSKTHLQVTFVRADYDPAFSVGIVSDGDITIHGSPDITGGMHANGNLAQTGSGTIDGDVSANGTVSVGSSVNGTETANAEEIDVPLITSDDFDEWRTEAQSGSNIYSNTDYIYSDTGDQSNKIVFADGDVEVSGSALQNTTIIATGNITVSGSSDQNADGGIGVAMMAGGDITFNGSSHTYGAFWCNGDFVVNGASTLEGSIVAGGSVTRNGTFNFVFNETLDNDNLPPGYDCTLASWKDDLG